MIHIFRTPHDAVPFGKFGGDLPDVLVITDLCLSRSSIMGATLIAYQMEPHNPNSDYQILKNRIGSIMGRVSGRDFKLELRIALNHLDL